MDDEQFVASINKIASEKRFRLPTISESPPSSEVVSAWAEFLEACVRNGVKLSDPRWTRVTIGKQKPVTVFELPNADAKPSDTDFKVGLRLLMGMFDNEVE